ncbi:hypothetical protein EJ02DRAFT_7215 [Clathrospora elynae]|uniref:DUF6604 domain-containing protein n=1 Tax=Clathrospora elynae TaxID=706981 RepID=A0A6A5T5H4_9PLEO|nr:hypothetical protein EJ02DRAFT_7215 [Clathrospora elynae]
MAEAVAKNQQIVQITYPVKVHLGRAIDVRQAISQWFAGGMAGDQDEEVNQTHQHFINILEDTFDVLWSFNSFQRKRGKRVHEASSTTASTAEQFASRFSKLTVEEPSETDSSSQQAPDQSLPPVPKVIVERLQDEIEEELFFAINALLRELHDIREMLVQVCNAYKQRKLDLSILSLSPRMSPSTLFGGLSSHSKIPCSDRRAFLLRIFQFEPSQHFDTASNIKTLLTVIWKKW